jgi:hypothetical protein
MRLGDLLIEAGLIDAQQLQLALEHQRAHDGRLGTTLIDLGMVNEAALAHVLASQLQIPSATPSLIENAARLALQRVPADLAVRHACCPVALDGNRLQLAMSDPTDTKAIRHVAQVSGCEVRPLVAPETLIATAIFRHYGGGRPRRMGRAQAETAPRVTIADLAERLVLASSEGEVFDALLAFLCRDFARAAVLTLRGGALAGSRTAGALTDGAALRSFSSPAAEVPLVARALEGSAPIVENDATGLGALSATLAPPGGATLALPLRQPGGARACAVAVGGGADAAAREGEYAAAARKVEIALELCDLRRRLLA